MKLFPYRIMSVMAHPDDFEFNAGGTFALLKKKYGSKIQMRILSTQSGATGHHRMTLKETFKRRTEEGTKAAAMVGADFRSLIQLDRTPVMGQVQMDRNFMGGLWNAIREFEPHAIFCPPYILDPLAGIHIDHQHTAHAMRAVAYQLLVPKAYPTMNGPVKLRVPYPVIFNVTDPYAATHQYHIRQDIRSVYALREKMLLCHESQIHEWLPWVDGYDGPFKLGKWKKTMLKRSIDMNQRHGFNDKIPSEYFQITHWGRAPTQQELEMLFPKRLKI